MTKRWTNEPLWPGATVAVLACGPSLTQEVVDAINAQEVRVIVVNDAHRLAPWADMLVALDAHWPQDFRDFAGMRLTGIEDEDLDAFYIGPRYESVRLSPSTELHVNNSGLAAIRIAAQMGAARILLAGFDPERPGHFYDDDVDEHVGVAIGIRQMTDELATKGVVVELFKPYLDNNLAHREFSDSTWTPEPSKPRARRR